MASGDLPALQLNGSVEPTTMDNQPTVQRFGETQATIGRPSAARNDTNLSKFSMMSVPPEGSILTGKQEHCE
jgi:hypothetical protein